MGEGGRFTACTTFVKENFFIVSMMHLKIVLVAAYS